MLMIHKFNYGLATLYSGDEKYLLQYTWRYKHLLHVYVKQTKTIGSSSYQLDSHFTSVSNAIMSKVHIQM